MDRNAETVQWSSESDPELGIIVLMVSVSSSSSDTSFVIRIIVRSNHQPVHRQIVAWKKPRAQYANVNQMSSFCKKHFWCLLKSEALLVQYSSLPLPPSCWCFLVSGAKLSPGVKYYNNIWISFASKIVF